MAESQYRPVTPSLLGSRLKLKRAVEHLDELEPEIRAYVQRDPYRVSDESNVEGEWIIVTFAEVREYPDPAWGVRIGEVFHNLRSALDNLVWQLVLVNGQQPGNHNQFPIYTDPTKPPGGTSFKPLKGVPGATRIDEMLFGVAPRHIATIKDLQPYLGLHVHRHHKVALGGVVELNNIDKHRFVHPAIGISQKGDTGIAKHIGGPPPKTVEIRYRLGAIYPGAEVLRWRVIGGTDETKMTMEGKIPFDVAFGHENTTLSHLDWLHERISEIVERFAPAFPADPSQP